MVNIFDILKLCCIFLNACIRQITLDHIWWSNFWLHRIHYYGLEKILLILPKWNYCISHFFSFSLINKQCNWSRIQAYEFWVRKCRLKISLISLCVWGQQQNKNCSHLLSSLKMNLIFSTIPTGLFFSNDRFVKELKITFW